MEPEQAVRAIRQARTYGLHAAGFHIYSGSQNLDGQKIAAAQQQAADVALNAARAARLDLHELNVGGGFGVPYHAGQASLDPRTCF
ncbi:MAG: hypothetical protein M5U09_10000 [Gammaproteobacteria bacterium]|nr:hypothetical protein [Gammaproteobacteria bacterium]